MRKTPVAVAIVLAVVGTLFGLIALSRLPQTLTLAVGPEGRETHRYALAVADAARDARERIRFNIVVAPGAAESAKLLDARKVDLAIVRSDYEWPQSGQTILVNTKRSVVILAPQPRRGGLAKLADLKGKRVGVIRLTDPNMPLVKTILAAADIGEADVTLTEIDMAEAGEQLGAAKLDAIIAIVVPTAPMFVDWVSQLARRVGGLRVIPLDGAQGIADRITGLEAVEIPAGAFGSGRPAEELSTVAISYRTVAHQQMSEDLGARVAKTLFDLRSRVNRQVPTAFTAEAPSATTGPKLPVHPGAEANFEGETKTFYERYGEMIFAGLWGASIIGSGLTAFVAWAGRRRHREGSEMVDEIARLTSAARTATPQDLESIQLRGDSIVATLANLRQNGHISDGVLEAAALALDHFRSVVDARA